MFPPSRLLFARRPFLGVPRITLDPEQVHRGVFLVLMDRALAVEPQRIPSASRVVGGYSSPVFIAR